MIDFFNFIIQKIESWNFDLEITFSDSIDRFYA